MFWESETPQEDMLYATISHSAFIKSGEGKLYLLHLAIEEAEVVKSTLKYLKFLVWALLFDTPRLLTDLWKLNLMLLSRRGGREWEQRETWEPKGLHWLDKL